MAGFRYDTSVKALYTIRIERDAEAGVWIATSDHVPGLITEATTIDGLRSRLSTMIPELLRDNDCLPNEREITVKLPSGHFNIDLSDYRKV